MPRPPSRAVAFPKKPPALKKGERSGGTLFKNLGNPLKATDMTVTYQEFDVNPYDGVKRDSERVVIGSDGRCWYTNDHYTTFTELK